MKQQWSKCFNILPKFGIKRLFIYCFLNKVYLKSVNKIYCPLKGNGEGENYELLHHGIHFKSYMMDLDNNYFFWSRVSVHSLISTYYIVLGNHMYTCFLIDKNLHMDI